MEKTSSLDTNILIRLITKDKWLPYKRATKLLSDQSHNFIVEDVAITETVYALEAHYYLSRQSVVDGLKLLFDIDNLRLNRPVFASVIPLYLTHPKLSFNDCYLAVMSKHHSAEPLYTFDKKLATQLPSAKLA